jgi:hypothetical protein
VIPASSSPILPCLHASLDLRRGVTFFACDIEGQLIGPKPHSVTHSVYSENDQSRRSETRVLVREYFAHQLDI